MVKIAKNPWLIAAASGDYGSTVAVRKAVRRGARTPEDLVNLVNSASNALVLTHHGLFQIQAGLICPQNGTAAVGSGADLALGFLEGLQMDQKIPICPHHVKAAIRFVAKKRNDCGGGCDVRFFDPYAEQPD